MAKFLPSFPSLEVVTICPSSANRWAGRPGEKPKSPLTATSASCCVPIVLGLDQPGSVLLASATSISALDASASTVTSLTRFGPAIVYAL